MSSVNAPDFAPLTYVWRSDPVNWFGPLFLNLTVDSFFFGLSCSQFWTYYALFPKDALWIKRLVAVAFLLSAFKGVQSTYLIWEGNVAGFGDWENAARIGWGLYLEPVTVVIASTAAQTFFGWRCYCLAEHNKLILCFLVTTISTVLGLSFCLAIQLASNAYDGPAIKRWAVPMLILGVFLDMTITLVISYKLIASKNQFNPSTDTLVNKLLIIVWQSALPPSISHLASVAVNALSIKTPMWNHLSNSFTMWLYVLSLMYTINSRGDFRRAQNPMIEGYTRTKNGGDAISLNVRNGNQHHKVPRLGTLENTNPSKH